MIHKPGSLQEREIAHQHEKIIGDNFRAISESVHLKTGFFPAVDGIKTPESQANHMPESWVRDGAMIFIGMIESVINLKKLSPGNELADEISVFTKENITTVLSFLNQPRWIEKFDQPIIDYVWYTALSGNPPEVHMKQDGTRCEGTENGPWDQNQPEAWGDFLIAVGRAKETGIIDEYSNEQIRFIKTIAGYLTRIQPWKFECAGMWEGQPGRSPTSRSAAISIAKGLDAVSFLFEDDLLFQKQIDNMVELDMTFVKSGIDTDYTAREGHPDGADLAMLVAMALPDSKRTKLPFAQYVDQNGERLGIGELPGAIRYIGDSYYKEGGLGEARWFMADPILAIGYFREAQITEDSEGVKLYRSIARLRFEQALEILSRYGYPPELFIPKEQGSIKDPSVALIKDVGQGKVALVPLERSLLWNRALIMLAASEATLALRPLDQPVAL